MPPLPAFKVEAIAQLERELRFVPRPRLLKDIDRAEALAADIDPAGEYPQDWLVYRVTGYRPAIDNPPVIPGSALLGDLSTLVERLCHAAALAERDHKPGTLLGADEVCRRLGITRKTLDRRRREGLIARRVLAADAKPRLAFRESVLEKWLAARGPRAEDQPAKSRRIPPELAARMIRRAKRYRGLGCSLSAAAARIAARFGRSHEGVRQLLKRHDAAARGRGEPPIFDASPAMDAHRRAVMLRARARGIDLGDMARKYARSRGAVRRALTLARAENLADLLARKTIAPHTAPTFDLPDAREVLLAPAPVRSGLGAPGAPTLAALVASFRAPAVPSPAVESARLVAYHFLLRSAARAIARLDRLHPSSDAVDRIETDLCWAARLKSELLRAELRVVLGAVEGRLARPIDSLPLADIGPLLLGALHRAAAAVDALDPFRGSRLAGAASLAVDRFMSQWMRSRPPPPSRRAATLIPADATVPDWTLRLCPWQASLEPDPRLRAALHRLPPAHRDFLSLRFGWSGGPPATLAELARHLGLDAIRVSKLEQDSLDDAWRAARA